jgi:ankyrin repeat protein
VSSHAALAPLRASPVRRIAGSGPAAARGRSYPTEDERHSDRATSWSPLRCAVASANSGPSNQAVIELLLGHGAIPDDHDLYLAGFAHDRHQLLRLLLGHVPNLPETAEMALAAPISSADVEAVRILLRAGADPRRYVSDDGQETPVVSAAIRSGCSAKLLQLLLEHGADPIAAGPDGRSPHRVATAAGRPDLAELLRRYGAGDQATDSDRFLSACLQG